MYVIYMRSTHINALFARARYEINLHSGVKPVL